MPCTFPVRHHRNIACHCSMWVGRGVDTHLDDSGDMSDGASLRMSNSFTQWSLPAVSIRLEVCGWNSTLVILSDPWMAAVYSTLLQRKSKHLNLPLLSPHHAVLAWLRCTPSEHIIVQVFELDTPSIQPCIRLGTIMDTLRRATAAIVTGCWSGRHCSQAIYFDCDGNKQLHVHRNEDNKDRTYNHGGRWVPQD